MRKLLLMTNIKLVLPFTIRDYILRVTPPSGENGVDLLQVCHKIAQNRIKSKTVGYEGKLQFRGDNSSVSFFENWQVISSEFAYNAAHHNT